MLLPTNFKRLNVDNAQIYIPQFLLCLDDDIVTLAGKISLKLRGIHLSNFIRALILPEKKISTVTRVIVSSFQLFVL